MQAGDGRQQALRVRVGGLAQHVLRRAQLAHLPGIHHGDAVAQVGRQRQVVGDEEHADGAFGLQLLEQVHDLRLDAHVERAGGLVEDEQRRIVGERGGDHHALLHAAAELVRVALGRAGGQADAGEQLADPGRGLGLAHAVHAQALAHLVAHADDGVERVHRALEDHGHAAPADLLAELLIVHRAQVVAGEADAAPDDRSVMRQQSHQRDGQAGLATAGFADDAQRLAGFQVES